MKIDRPEFLQCLVNPYPYEDQYFLCITAMMMFDFQERKYTVDSKTFWKIVTENVSPSIKIDNYLPKESGCFLAAGHCYSYNSETARSHASIQFGHLKKTIEVYGNRRKYQKDLYRSTSSPEYFDKIALNYENSYGGQDYKYNPYGKGIPSKKNQEEIDLPNTQLPNDESTPANFLPRLYDDELTRAVGQKEFGFDKDWPKYAPDFNGQRLRKVPEDQLLERFIKPAETFEIENMHPQQRLIQGTVPGQHLRGFYKRKGKERIEELALQFSTVWLFPHEYKGASIFHGLIEVENFVEDDIEWLQFELEDKPTRLDGEAYRQKLKDKQPNVETEWAKRNKNTPKPTESYDDGLDFSKFEQRLTALAGNDEAARSPELSNYLEQMQKAKPEEMTGLVSAYAKHLESKSSKKDFDIIGNFDKEDPSDYKPDYEIMRREIKKSGLNEEQMKAVMAQIEEVEKHRQKLIDLRFPGMGSIGSTLNPSMRRKEVIRAHAAGVPIKQQSLAGLDLSNLNLSGIQLIDCDLTQTNLNNSLLIEASLEGSYLDKTAIIATDFSKSNFSKSILRNLEGDKTYFSKCNLHLVTIEDCVFHNSYFINIVSDQYKIVQTQFLQCYFNHLTSEGCSFQQCNFIEPDFRQTKFNLIGFQDCQFEKAKYQKSEFKSSKFVNCLLESSLMENATFTKTSYMNCEWEDIKILNTDLSESSFTKTKIRRCTMAHSLANQSAVVNCEVNDFLLQDCEMNNFRIVQESFIQRVNFRSCNLQESSFMESTIHGMKIQHSDLLRAQYNQCHINELYFEKCKGREMRFVGCIINNANVEQSDFLNVIVYQTALNHCDFIDSNLYGSTFNYCPRKNTIFKRCLIKEELSNEESH